MWWVTIYAGVMNLGPLGGLVDPGGWDGLTPLRARSPAPALALPCAPAPVPARAPASRRQARARITRARATPRHSIAGAPITRQPA